MLTGRMPYAASNAQERTRKVLHEMSVSPARVAGADEVASAIVLKCLEKRPERRFRHFKELRAALESWASRNGWSSVIPALVTVDELESAMTARDWANRGHALG
jgi:hypothetical protein